MGGQYLDGKVIEAKVSSATPVVPSVNKAALKLPARARASPSPVRVASRSIRPPMAVTSISSRSPHVRWTPMGCTCGEPDEIKKNTHPKNVTALFRDQARAPAPSSLAKKEKTRKKTAKDSEPGAKGATGEKRRGQTGTEDLSPAALILAQLAALNTESGSDNAGTTNGTADAGAGGGAGAGAGAGGGRAPAQGAGGVEDAGACAGAGGAAEPEEATLLVCNLPGNMSGKVLAQMFG